MYPDGIQSLAFLVAFFSSLFISVLLVITTKWHGRFSLDGLIGVQKFHDCPTPRVGGVAIFGALILACTVATPPLNDFAGPILLAAIPAFLFGLAEDLTKRVSIRTRLFATMASGFLAWYLTGYRVSTVGVESVDWLLTMVPLSVIFTAFSVSGVANAVNIIDGFNGLAAGTVAICLFSLSAIAFYAGDLVLAQFGLVVAAVIGGFLLVNFPFGKLFLGDGGAYLLGFLLAWVAVSLHARNPEVSPWAPFLACGYPIFETIFTIIRRVWLRSNPGMPDSHHLHSLIKVAIVRRFFTAWRPVIRNASVSPFSWALASIPALISTAFWSDSKMLQIGVLISFVVYLGFYYYLASAAGAPLQHLLGQQAANDEELMVETRDASMMRPMN
jgi:UDP-N-acetylmuramyl pentapeptide phosphotransferase/UDP-N-acetylglucosamine-1-phosphate transferase